jgi:hypothetical protein
MATAELDRGGDAQQPAYRSFVQGSGQRPCIFGEQGAGVFSQSMPRGGGRQPTGGPLYQPLARARFEVMECTRHGGWRSPQFSRGARETAGLHDRHEDRQFVQPIHTLFQLLKFYVSELAYSAGKVEE